jgi:hypothetical protein
MSYAAAYRTNAHAVEAWQRISPTQLRKKIVTTWQLIYVGIPSQSDAEELLSTVIAETSVKEGSIALKDGGYWECAVSYKTAEWVSPAKYIYG